MTVPAGREAFDDLVTGDEIRELLADEASRGEQGCEQPEIPSAGAARILIVSRRAADVEVLRASIENAGASAAVARNPFTALDRLRGGRFDAVITDLDAWAQDGKLLFERIGELGREVPVLFVGERSLDRGTKLEERARRAGASGPIYRPLSPGEVESVARSLIARTRARAPERPAREETSFSPGGEGTRLAPAPPDLPWLRLFHAMSRLRRSALPPNAFARELAQLVQGTLEPEAVGIFYPGHSRDGRSWTCLAASSISERGFEAVTVGAAALDERRLVIEIGPSARMVIQGLAGELRETAGPYAEDLAELMRDLFPPS